MNCDVLNKIQALLLIFNIDVIKYIPLVCRFVRGKERKLFALFNNAKGNDARYYIICLDVIEPNDSTDIP